jgi:hypothetical protein
MARLRRIPKGQSVKSHAGVGDDFLDVANARELDVQAALIDDAGADGEYPVS